MQTVDAVDSATALKTAANIAPNSGVMLYRSQQGGVASPYQPTGTVTTTPPGGSTTTTPSSGLSTNAQSIISGINANASTASTDPLTVAKNNIMSTFSTPPAAPDQATILKQKQDAAQQLVNSINSQYVSKYTQANTDNASREARVRAITANSGLSGSNAGSSNLQKASDESTKNIGMIDDEKNAKINEVLGNVSQQSSDEYAKQRAAYLTEINGDYDKINAFQTSEMNLAKTNMQALAANGVDLSSLQTKAPDTYQQLLKQSGMTPAVFAAVYNQSLPANQQRQYSYEKIGNDFYAISVDPTTNKPTAQKLDTPTDGNTYDSFMIAPDGTPLFINKTTGTLTKATGNYSKPQTTKTTNPSGMTADEKKQYNLGLSYLRTQPDYQPSDEDTYKNDPVSQAYVIKAAQAQAAKDKIASGA